MTKACITEQVVIDGNPFEISVNNNYESYQVYVQVLSGDASGYLTIEGSTPYTQAYSFVRTNHGTKSKIRIDSADILAIKDFRLSALRFTPNGITNGVEIEVTIEFVEFE